MVTHRRLATAIFFVAFFVLGLYVLDDYGISMDEALQRDHGRVALTYWFDKLNWVPYGFQRLDQAMPAYGMFFQFLAGPLELLFGVQDDMYDYFRLRHLLQFLLFFLAVASFYRLLRYRWRVQRYYPLLGALVLVASPRIFAHAFFDPKDVLFLDLYLIATYTMCRYLSRRTMGALILHAIATGVVLGSRQVSILIPALTIALVLYEDWKPLPMRIVRQLPPYFLMAGLLGLLFNPHLYMDSGDGLLRTVTNVASYHWEGMVFFMGKIYDPGTIPFYYLPVWIGLTIPLVYLGFILYGSIVAGARMGGAVRRLRPYFSAEQRMDFLVLALTYAPVAAVFVLDARLYQGWRHLYFIYPGMVYLLVVGYDRLHGALPRAANLLLGLGVAVSVVTMVRIHPHQQVYFNLSVWAGPSLLGRFELDYWGVSYRAAFLELARQIPAGQQRSVLCEGWPCMTNLRSLPLPARSKFRETSDWATADYFTSNFYYPTHRDQTLNRESIFGLPVVEIAPGGHIIIGIYPATIP